MLPSYPADAVFIDTFIIYFYAVFVNHLAETADFFIA